MSKSKHQMDKWMKKEKGPLARHLKKNGQMYLLLVIPITYYIIFKYLPMMGNIIAFRKYRAGGPIFGVKWSGFKYFAQFMRDKIFWRAFVNTFVLNAFYFLWRVPLTLIFALLLNEIKNIRWKKFVQTVSYLPHFIAVVIVCGMVKELVSVNGPINALLKAFGVEAIRFIQLPQWFSTIFVTSRIWQSLGWGTILYSAAIAGINPQLYEAAKVDGANRYKQAWHITIPAILPTITTILILDIGSIMGTSDAFESIMMLYNEMTYEKADVISTYVYRMGVRSGNYSYATAVGLFEGVIGTILIVLANRASRKLTNNSLW